MTYDLKRRLTLTAAAVAFSMLPVSAYADVLVAKAADPTEQGDGTMSAAASAAMIRGALPKNAAEVAAKAAATSASSGALAPSRVAAAGGGSGAGPLATISGGHNFAGQFNATSTPPDTTGAIGTTRYIELVNTRFGIYNRTTNALINFGHAESRSPASRPRVNTFDPQIIWDAQTNRFFYFNDSIFSASDNRLSWGFSKTASPANGTSTHWCKYTTGFGTRFPDYPKLGDSFYFTDRRGQFVRPRLSRVRHHQLQQAAGGHDVPGWVVTSRSTGSRTSIRFVHAGAVRTRSTSSATGYVVARNRRLAIEHGCGSAT